MLDQGRNARANTSRIRNCALRRRSLSGEVKRFRQFGCAEHVCDALEVVSHCRYAYFGSRTGQPTHQQTRMSEDAVLDRSVRMLDRASAQSHRLWRHTPCILFNASSNKWRAKPRLEACVQRGFSEQVPQSPDEALYMV